MAVKSDYFNPQTYYYKVLILCCMLVIDILFNSFTQFINFGVKIRSTSCQEDDVYLCSGLALIQFVLIIIMILVLLNIFSETYYFKRGLLGVICGKFLFSFIFLLLYPIFFCIERAILGYRLNQMNKNDESETNTAIIDIWKKPIYIIFYIIKYVMAFGFYIGILRTSFELGKTEYYINEQFKSDI